MGDSFCNLGANNKISDCSEGSAGPEPGGSPVSSGVTTSAKKHNRTSKSKLIGAADTPPLAQTHAHQSSEPHLRRYNALLSASESTLTLERQCVKVKWKLQLEALSKVKYKLELEALDNMECKLQLEALAPNDSLRRHGGNGVVLHGALFKTELK
ncbi:hypothetical protein PF003_g23642 [Phytophthora fragariae]|nr:hypothetical protein PF003_g23642 [Phytophthora fragariae]